MIEHTFDQQADLNQVPASRWAKIDEPVTCTAHVIVHQNFNDYPGLLIEWQREPDGYGYFNWSAKVVYLDGDQLLHQGWFPEARVKPAPRAEPDQTSRPHASLDGRSSGQEIQPNQPRSSHE